MELGQGWRNDVLPVTQNISELACLLFGEYALSHNLFMADALIAAMPISHSLSLLTGNGKHLTDVAGLELWVFKP